MSHIEHDRNADLRPTRLGIHHASLPLGHHTEHAQHLTVAGSIEMLHHFQIRDAAVGIDDELCHHLTLHLLVL